MVVNQAHLGCNKSVVLSLGSSRSGSRIPGFDQPTVQIAGLLWEGIISRSCCIVHPRKSLFAMDQHVLAIKSSMNFLTSILIFVSKDYFGSQQELCFPLICKKAQLIQCWLIQRWLIELYSLNWKLLASPTMCVTSQNYIPKCSWLRIMSAPAAIPTGTVGMAYYVISYIML